MSPAVSIVVVSKGRLGHLRVTLPMLLAQDCPFEFEVLAVDFGCPQGTFDWCCHLDHRRLTAVKVLEDTADFHLSRSRNCGAALAQGQVLAFVDADMRARPGWLAAASGPILAGSHGLARVSHDPTGWDRMGTCVVSAALFHQVRGYDEALRGWGCEDMDFYRRSEKLSPVARFSPTWIEPIRHGHDERVRFQAAKSILISERQNRELLRTRETVNPHGYGQGTVEIARGTRDYQLPTAGTASTRIRRSLRLR